MTVTVSDTVIHWRATYWSNLTELKAGEVCLKKDQMVRHSSHSVEDPTGHEIAWESTLNFWRPQTTWFMHSPARWRQWPKKEVWAKVAPVSWAGVTDNKQVQDIDMRVLRLQSMTESCLPLCCHWLQPSQLEICPSHSPSQDLKKWILIVIIFFSNYAG